MIQIDNKTQRIIDVIPNEKITILKDEYIQIVNFLDELLNEQSIFNIKSKIRTVLQKDNINFHGSI